MTISRDQASVFNEVSIDSNDPDLWRMANPLSRTGESRIEVHVAGDQFDFLLETRSGASGGFTLWGRDITARESGEFSGEIEYSFSDNPKTASAAAAEMATVSAVDWDADDWLLPDDFDFCGAPIDGIVMLATEIGAVVRAQADGSLLVRDRYPVRPVDMSGATAVVSYDQEDLIALRKDNVLHTLFDAVSVSFDQGVAAIVPSMEMEEQSPTIGQTVHLRVYWGAGNNTTFSRFATSGLVQSMGMVSETVEETVEFVNSAATVQRPVMDVERVQWIGVSGGEVSFTVGGTELTIGADGEQLFAVAVVRYQTQYERLSLRGSSVPRAMAALYLDALEASGYVVNVVASDAADDPVYGDVINTNLLTSMPPARVRGQAWLDDHHYTYDEVTFSAAYQQAAVDGAVAYINDAEVGDRGNYHIMSAPIVIEGPMVINTITARRWHV